MILDYKNLKIEIEEIVTGIEKAAIERDKKKFMLGTLRFTKILSQSPGVLPLEDLNMYTSRFREAKRMGGYTKE